MIALFLALLLTATSPAQMNSAVESSPLHQQKQTVKVYQTPQQAGSLTVQSSADASLSFYLFDLNGNLVYQSQIGQREQQIIEGLLPGTYTYHAFCADEKIKGGKVEIRN